MRGLLAFFPSLVSLSLLFSSAPALAQLIPVYEPARRAEYIQAADAFRAAQVLERTAYSLNSFVRLPVKMPLVLRECGSANAYYRPIQRDVTLCYELMEQVISGITRDFGEAPMEHKMEAAVGALYFILFHEIGHGLSHTLRLPILGKEEDAADSIAAYLLLNSRDPLPSVIGTLWFFTNAVHQPTLRDFADEHSLGHQRAYALLCQALGKDRATYAELAERFRLPQERAVRCVDEYSQLSRAVRSLLGKHLY